MTTQLFVNDSTLSDAGWFNDADTMVYGYLTSVAGTNTITATGPASLTAYAAGQVFRFIVATTNSGATTINISSLGAKNIYYNNAALSGGELLVGVPITIMYDGTRFHAVAGVQPQTVPSGTMFDFGGTSAPSGYLACDGSAVSRTTYAALFAAIGTTWGAGDTTTTFNLPDLRRRVTVGSGGTGTGTLGNAVGNTGGSEDAIVVTHTHTGTTDSSGAHTHTVSGTVYATDGGASPSAGQAYGTGTASSAAFASADSGGAHTHPFTTDSAGSSGTGKNVQPSAIVLKIIKV